MIKNISLKILSLLLVFNIYSCAQTDGHDITVSDLTALVQNEKSLVILDVRILSELTGPLGKMDNVLNIPVQDLARRIGELENYKDNEIAVICRTGRRSGIATNILVGQGFKARNVLGGMVEYRQLKKAEVLTQ